MGAVVVLERIPLVSLGFVWLQESGGNQKAFWALLKRRLCDDFIFKQDWTMALNSSERFSLYSSFKFKLLTESYFDMVQVKCFRNAVIKLRLGVLPLNANLCRYAQENTFASPKSAIPLKILCSFRENEIEDELHFIYLCPLYKELCKKYIDSRTCAKWKFVCALDAVSREKIESESCTFCISCLQKA